MEPEVSAPFMQNWTVFPFAGQMNPIQMTTICFWIFYLKTLTVGKNNQITI